MNDYSIKPMHDDQWPQVLALLAENDLPEAGLRDHRDGVLVAAGHGRIVGSVALEIHGAYGLLRSLAVASHCRGQGLGESLTKRILLAAAECELREVYLLTETAESFFTARGFATVGREEVPDPIRKTTEFSEVCPTSATVMVFRTVLDVWTE